MRPAASLANASTRQREALCGSLADPMTPDDVRALGTSFRQERFPPGDSHSVEFIDASAGSESSVLVIVCNLETRERVLRLLQNDPREPGSVASPVLQIGGLRIDRDAHRVSVEGRDVNLTALEFKLLTTLVERVNRVQTRATLLHDVWGVSAKMTTRTIDVHVNRLREKLGAAGLLIQAVRGVGYCLTVTPQVDVRATHPDTAAGFALTTA